MPPSFRLWLLGGADRSGFLARLGVGLVYTTVLLAAYQWVAGQARLNGRDLSLPIDHQIPFLPWTFWFYIPMYVLIFLLPVMAVHDWRTFARMAAALTIAATPATILHALMPVAYPRPPMPVGDGITLDGLRLLWAFDPPHNTFPSLHITMATTMTLAGWRWRRELGWICASLTAAMTVSVLTLKQHFIVDIPGGWACAALAWALVLRRASVPSSGA